MIKAVNSLTFQGKVDGYSGQTMHYSDEDHQIMVAPLDLPLKVYIAMWLYRRNHKFTEPVIVDQHMALQRTVDWLVWILALFEMKDGLLKGLIFWVADRYLSKAVADLVAMERLGSTHVGFIPKAEDD